MKNKKLIILTVVSALMILSVTEILMPLAEKQGEKLGKQYNLSQFFYGLFERSESLVMFQAKAEEPKKLSTEERFFEAIRTDINFRAYVVNMVVPRMNPGNLRCANQPFSECANGFASFPDTITGFRALLMQIEADKKRGDTIKTFIEDYAPRGENNTDKYIADVSELMGRQADTKLSDLDLLQLATVITACEHSIFY